MKQNLVQSGRSLNACRSVLVKNVTTQKTLHRTKNQRGGHRRASYRSVPPSSSPHTPGRPGLVPAPDAALTVRAELKLQEFVAELALVTHVVTQIKVTLHGSRKATETGLQQRTAARYAPDSDV